MFKDILSEKGISVYLLSKKSGIPYSTLSDIVNGKTDIKDSSARILHSLAESLAVPMDVLYSCNDEPDALYIYNTGRTVTVKYRDMTISYQGPKNLIALKEVRYLSSDMVAHIMTYYKNDDVIDLEEEFYDLKDLFKDNGYELPMLSADKIHVGKPGKSEKDSFIDRAIIVSDYMAILPSDLIDQPDSVLVVNISRPSNKAHIRLSDYAVLLSNMKDGMAKRASEAVERNISLIRPAIEERRRHA